MGPIAPVRALLVGLLLLGAGASRAQGPDLSFCGELRPVERQGVPVGHLCIVTPSATDLAGSGLLDLDPDCSLDEDGEACIAGNGFGNHVVGVPLDLGPDSPVAVLISGAYGAPHSPILQDHLGIEPGPPDDVRYLATLSDALATGHLVLQPAYRNPSSVNRDVCTAAVTAQNPHCHFLVRTLVLEGEQRCPPFAPGCAPLPELQLSPDGSLDGANAWLRRLDLLLAHLLAEPLPWPDAIDPLRWDAVRLAGHSQGAGHVYLLATLRQRVRRACYLAGPRDWDQALSPPRGDFAAWFLPYPQVTRTPKQDMRGLVSETDGNRAIERAWEHVGLTLGLHTRTLPDLDDDGNGHEEIISDPVYGNARTTACFSDAPLVAEVPALGPTGLVLLALGLAWMAQRLRR